MGFAGTQASLSKSRSTSYHFPLYFNARNLSAFGGKGSCYHFYAGDRPIYRDLLNSVKLRLADFFQSYLFFQKQFFMNTIRLSYILDPDQETIWVQTVCIGYQQMKKDAASMGRAKGQL